MLFRPDDLCESKEYIIKDILPVGVKKIVFVFV